jgi:hypothetical protein
MDKKLLKIQWCVHSSIGDYQHRAIHIGQFIVMSHIWFALNKTKIKRGDLLLSLVEAIGIQRTEEHDVDEVARV